MTMLVNIEVDMHEGKVSINRWGHEKQAWNNARQNALFQRPMLSKCNFFEMVTSNSNLLIE